MVLFHNYHLDAFRRLHTFLHQIQVDRIIFGDPAVVMFVKNNQILSFYIGMLEH